VEITAKEEQMQGFFNDFWSFIKDIYSYNPQQSLYEPANVEEEEEEER